jgi:hypothetical protein
MNTFDGIEKSYLEVLSTLNASFCSLTGEAEDLSTLDSYLKKVDAFLDLMHKLDSAKATSTLYARALHRLQAIEPVHHDLMQRLTADSEVVAHMRAKLCKTQKYMQCFQSSMISPTHLRTQI